MFALFSSTVTSLPYDTAQKISVPKAILFVFPAVKVRAVRKKIWQEYLFCMEGKVPLRFFFFVFIKTTKKFLNSP